MPQYEFLNELPAHKFYEELDKEKDIQQYYDKCYLIKTYYPGNNDLLKICGKLYRNLKILYDIINEDILQDKRCDYLNNWIYNEVIEKFDISDSYIYSNKIITYMTYNWDSFIRSADILNKCFFEKHIMNKQEFTKKKVLFDDTENYNSIKTKINNNDYENNSNYYKYITENYYLKSLIESECSCDNNNMFCIKFHKYNEENGKDKLCSLKCNEAITSPSPKEKTDLQCTVSEKVEEDTKDEEELKYVDNETLDDVTLSNPTGAIVTIPILLTFICIFLLVFFLYKFTPYGLRLYEIIQRKKKCSNHIYEETVNDILKNTSASDQINSDDMRYNVYYQSLSDI
ncbi:PIR Superfamily Protein [Plasmodium ovale wallikeri]|uniref:PIR Superfamily Protein n=2 Tax=Plasmodium ovale TaxID=36330 RepID=A0A1A9AR69_PLAOA|nr:PIR Superfamily Protein [Plasmodium ovale wallikeri]SBT59198.1 PIR Superfamily Protein [Plasmodium ovale wallikeri]SBT73772.1 PIR protein [Plasmodium ovale]